MRVLYVASECFPLVKTGGLGDVTAALPAALARLGLDVRLVLPGFPGIIGGLIRPRPLTRIRHLPGGADGTLLLGLTPAGIPAYVADIPSHFGRSGHPYMGPDGKDWPDNPFRFAAFSRVAADIALDLDPDWRPDIVHCHDWQSGLVPAYLAFAGLRRPATVMTIHNIAYQGQYPSSLLGALHLPVPSFATEGLEYYGDIGFLKAGLYYADRLTTVSPRYAYEIQTPTAGAGLQGLLSTRSDHLTGILNGVDDQIWDPRRDLHLAGRYGPETIHAKAASRSALRAEFDLSNPPQAPLLAFVSRLTWHKGVDVVADALPELARRGLATIVLGSGDPAAEAQFRRLSEQYKTTIGVRIGYDEALAHRMIGGADMILVPSRSEPCGLTQLYGLRYGTLPVVGRTGGLADTVIDANPAALASGTATGFACEPGNAMEFLWTMQRAAKVFANAEVWQHMQRTAMAQDFSWDTSARAYRDLFGKLRAARG